MNQNNRNPKQKKWIQSALTIFFLAVFLYAAWNLFLIWQEYQAGEDTYNQAQQEFLTPELENEFVVEEITWPTFSIDFTQLKQVNREICGWIWCYDTKISYPLVQSKKNNDAYLHVTYDGRSNSAGSIFMDYRNACDFSDDNSILYGHNMKNGTMFAGLKKFCNQEYYDTHREFYILTPDGNRRYEIIAAFQTDALSNIYSRNFANQEDKLAWLNQVLRSSAVLAPVTATEADTFVTLSTCVSGDNYRARIVVIGRLAEIEPIFVESDTTSSTME